MRRFELFLIKNEFYVYVIFSINEYEKSFVKTQIPNIFSKNIPANSYR